MTEILSQLFTWSLLAVILVKVAPLLLASIGGAFTQQASILNIGLEGMMLIGAFTAIAVGSTFKSSFIGVVAAVLAGLALSIVYALCALWLKADFIVVGIGVNILALGLSVFLLQIIYKNPGSTPAGASITLPKIDLGLGSFPLNNQTALVWLSFVSVGVFWFVLYRTRFGIHLRAVGEDLPAATAAGIDGRMMKFWAILIAGVLCGMAGAQLSMATLGSYTTNMTAGRGFIAVAALTFGRAKPVPTMVAALIFGTADALAERLGIAGVNSNLALMTPYVITIAALTFAALDLRKRRRVRTAAANAVAA